MNVLTRLFKRTPSPEPHPEAGEEWAKIADDSPRPKVLWTVKILDCREGWVRYQMHPEMFSDERMRLEIFVKIYRRPA